MKILSLLFLITTFLANATELLPPTCLSHGQCQEIYKTQSGKKCFIIRTGQDTCALRCYNIRIGSYCKKHPNEQIGICKREIFNDPSFDPYDPSRCDNAIDPFDF